VIFGKIYVFGGRLYDKVNFYFHVFTTLCFLFFFFPTPQHISNLHNQHSLSQLKQKNNHPHPTQNNQTTTKIKHQQKPTTTTPKNKRVNSGKLINTININKHTKQIPNNRGEKHG